MDFVHLHVHSHYSLLDGLSKIDDLVQKAKEKGMKALALTDHGNLYGAIEFFGKAKAAGIKPIIGCEVYVAPRSRFDRTPKIDDEPGHLVLLAKNAKGYKNLLKIVTLGYLEGFYYKPRVDYELLEKHKEGLIALSGCLQGQISRAVVANRASHAEALVQKHLEIFGSDFYLELQPHPKIPEQKIANTGIQALAKKFNIPMVATKDSHYLTPTDAEAQDILLCLQTKHKKEDSKRLCMLQEDFSFETEEIFSQFKNLPEVFENTLRIAQKCDLELELGKPLLPTFNVPQNFTAASLLKHLCKEGIKTRYPKETEEINKRLEYELGVIEKTGFASYFLIVWDLVRWAKEQGITVGPGRGSAAGSIVAYLLYITDLDPLAYNLVFERFLNPERISLPDIDLDFADARRGEILRYVEEKYGKDHVAGIVTFGTMAARVSVRDVGRVLGLPYSFCDTLAKMIPPFSTLKRALSSNPELNQLYNSNTQAKKIIDISSRIEGVARHASTHACGVVITPSPLVEYVPLQYASTSDKSIISQYEMHAIENLGLLKMDFLGLKNLTLLERARKTISKTKKETIDLRSIPLEDKKTISLLQKANTTGVFQLECLPGDTRVSNTTLEKLYLMKDKRQSLRSVYLDTGLLHNNQIINVVKTGKKKIFMIITEEGRIIKASSDHKFMTQNGWKKLGKLKREEDFLLYKPKAKFLAMIYCKNCGKELINLSENLRKHQGFCYACSARNFKNPSKPKSRNAIRRGQLEFYQKGGQPRNYSLNKNNNKILALTGKKISQSLTGVTWEIRYGHKEAEKKKRVFSKKVSGVHNPMFGKACPHRKGGFRNDLGHYVRSNWEADFARILKLHNITYKYEPKTFELIKGDGEKISYTPDFYTMHNNTFYEIKGWMHDLDLEKIKLFQKQYPKYNFILINTTKFAELALRYKNLISWECPHIPNQLSYTKIKEIKYVGKEMTYDIIMTSPGNNFIANSFVVHNSSGMKKYLKQLKPNCLEDVIAMVALYRPGPVELIPDYVAGKHKKRQPKYLHPKLKPILEKTYGIAVYQEQVLEIARELAGFSYGHADILRKAIGKKIPKLLKEQKIKFINGCVEHSIEKDVAEKIFAFIEPFAGYAFNRSHAACYATIAWQTAYLKANYPEEFMSCLLTMDMGDLDRIAGLIEECRGMGIKLLAPDINESLANFTVIGHKVIRFGLTAIKNVGEKLVETILLEREKSGPFPTLENFLLRMAGGFLNKKSLESLIKSGALQKLGEGSILLYNIPELLQFTQKKTSDQASPQMSLFGQGLPPPERKLNLKKVDPASKSQRLSWEKEVLGLYLSDHPFSEYLRFASGRTPLKMLKQKQGKTQTTIAGIITAIKKIFTRKGEPMLFARLEDEGDYLEAVVFPKVLESNSSLFQEGNPVKLSGRAEMSDEGMKFFPEKGELLSKVEELKSL